MTLPKQIWIGGSDLAGILLNIGGWFVDCAYHERSAAAVDNALAHGYVTYRTHYSPAIPDGAQAFEVTDAGLEKLREWGWSTGNAERMRQWHRERTSWRDTSHEEPSDDRS